MSEAQVSVFDAGMMRYNEVELAEEISDALSAYQQKLFALRSKVADQDIEPTLHLTMQELKRLTGRERRSDRYIERFMTTLKDHGLVVTFEDDTFCITKPAPKMVTHFTKFAQLRDSVSLSVPLPQTA